MNKSIAVLVFIALFAKTCVLARGDIEPSGQVQAEWKSQDRRLAARVNIDADRMSIGELLERVAADTHVDIRASDRDGGGDVEVLVRSRNLTLAEVMETLWSLVSYRGAEWAWVRSGTEESYSYTLVRPMRARALAEILRNEMQARFVAEVEAMISLATLSPADRKKRIGRVVRDVLDGDDKLAEALLKPLSDRKWSGLATMAEVLTTAQRQSVLCGEKTIKLSVDALPEDGKSFVNTIWKKAGGYVVHRDGTMSPTPQPTSILFQASRSSPFKMIPYLLIDVEGQGAYSYAGGTPGETAARKRLRKRWLQDGEEIDSPVAHGRFEIRKNPDRKHPNELANDRVLRQLADCSTFPLFARLIPSGRGLVSGGLEDPQGANISEWLNGPFDNYFQWKWRAGVMLAAIPSWIHHEVDVIPWKVLSLLRKSRDPSTGFLSMETICDVAGRLEWDQMASLRQQYHVLYDAARCHGALVELQRKPGILKRIRDSAGIPVAEALPLVALINDWPVDDLLRSGRVRALRLTEKLVPAGKRTDFELIDSDGMILSSRGFTDVGFTADDLMARRNAQGQN